MEKASLERIYPASSGETIASSDTLRLHLERYRFASSHLIPGLVADIACGSGYGTHLLATENKNISLLGVDNNETAIQYAKEHYAHPAIEFRLADALSFQAPRSLSTVVSLETIEHLPDPHSFVKHLSAQLMMGGRFIASAPITPSMDANPYHLQDFTIRSFRALFTEQGLVETSSFFQVQPYNPFTLFNKKKGREQEIRKNLIGYYFKHPGKCWLRIRSLFRDGFANKYAVLVFEKRF